MRITEVPSSGTQIGPVFIGEQISKGTTGLPSCYRACVNAAMIDHIDFAVRDLMVSRPFYTAVLAALGWSVVVEFDEEGRRGVGFGMGATGRLFIGGGEPVGGRLHVALPAKSREDVDEFYAAALAAGGTHHGSPGLRPQYGGGYYAAFVRDPDGHVIEAVFRG